MSFNDPTGDFRLYTYAVDGSGRHLRTRVEVLEESHESATVRFVDFIPPVDEKTECEFDVDRPDWRLVPSKWFSPVGSNVPLLSINYLD